MSTFALIYETNALTGLPSLRMLEGAAGAVSEAELRDLDRELQAKYEQLRREPSSTIRVRSKQYTVESKDPNGSRQPTLIIRPLGSNALVQVTQNGKYVALSWIEGFYAEVAKMGSDPAVPRLEAHALQAAVEELQAAAPEHAAELAATLMASYLALSEQLCRGPDQDRAGMYALALRGVGRLLPESSTDDGVGWRKPSATGRPEAPPESIKSHWLWRTLAKIICLPAGEHSHC
jgi:hypothetical protein